MSAVWLAIGGGPVYYRFDFFAWRTRSQSIRTEGEVMFEASLAYLSTPPVYQRMAKQALHLQQLGMNSNRIAIILGVERKSVVRAIRWIRNRPVYST